MSHFKKTPPLLLALITLAGFCVTPAQEKSSCAEFRKMLDETYNFKPSKLSPAERDAKSAAMDKVWNKVKADRDVLLPCLRESIKTRSGDAFFTFDAVNLLIQLDRGDESKRALIEAYAAVDFEDIDLRYWMPYVAVLGYEGFDTSAAGEKWMRSADPGYYLPQHGTLKVDKEIGALIIYGSMDESVATPALAKIAAREDHPAREIAVRLLLRQATPDSFRELRSLNQTGLSEGLRQKLNSFLSKPELLPAREGEPKITRQQYLDAFQALAGGKPQAFMRLATEVPDGEKDAVAVMKQEDIPLIRKTRRLFAASATPHSAEWYKSFTDILITMVWKPEPVN